MGRQPEREAGRLPDDIQTDRQTDRQIDALKPSQAARHSDRRDAQEKVVCTRVELVEAVCTVWAGQSERVSQIVYTITHIHPMQSIIDRGSVGRQVATEKADRRPSIHPCRLTATQR